jgi:hypothetical protein
LAIAEIARAVELVGAPPERVNAIAPRTGDDGSGDIALVTLVFEDGVAAQIAPLRRSR